jgi:hypothetical protein
MFIRNTMYNTVTYLRSSWDGTYYAPMMQLWTEKLRFCVNYRKLNDVTKRDIGSKAKFMEQTQENKLTCHKLRVNHENGFMKCLDIAESLLCVHRVLASLQRSAIPEVYTAADG